MKEKFKNIAALPSGSYQLKFKKDGIDIQKALKELALTIRSRNKVYLAANYRPKGLLVNFLDLDVVKEVTRQEKSGNVYTRYQVHSYSLRDRKYTPKAFSSKIDAATFAQKWLVLYNAIVSVYNGRREKAFLFALQREQEELKPFIETGFDLALWQEASFEVFGNEIPELDTINRGKNNERFVAYKTEL